MVAWKLYCNCALKLYIIKESFVVISHLNKEINKEHMGLNIWLTFTVVN